jgi:hypothetical protein
MKLNVFVIYVLFWCSRICLSGDLVGEDPVRQLESDAFQNRMRMFYEVWSTFLRDELDLSKQQLDRLDEASKIAIDTLNARTTGNEQQIQRRQLTCFPSNFTFAKGPSEQFSQLIDDDLQDLLDEEQKTKMTRLLDTRREKFSSACIGEVLNMIDYELFLAPKQRDSIRQLFEREKTNFNDAYYAFRDRNGQLQTSKRLNLEKVIAAGILTDSQTLHVYDLQDPQFTFVFNRYSHTLPEFMDRQTAAFESIMQIRVEYARANMSLTSRESRRLELVTAGIASRLLNKPYLDAVLLVQNAEGESNGGVIYPRTFQIEQHPFWKATVCQPKLAKLLEHRKLLRDRDTAAYVSAVLDSELYLSESQIVRLNDLASDALMSVNWESGIDYGKYRYYGMTDETQMRAMCVVMVGINDHDVHRILKDHQVPVWKLLRSYFTEDENRLFLSSSFDVRVHLGWLSRKPDDERNEPPL